MLYDIWYFWLNDGSISLNRKLFSQIYSPGKPDSDVAIKLEPSVNFCHIILSCLPTIYLCPLIFLLDYLPYVEAEEIESSLKIIISIVL